MKKNSCFHKITFLVTGISFALLPMEYAEAMNTQIQTDSTLSGISAMAVDSQGGNQIYTLSEINGKTVGGNLFYSFSNFSIGATDTAWFNLNTPDLANVISRITGGAESIIDGHLQMTNVGSAPSFFFINPAGVTFGAGASIDVPGSFYVSTASGLNMSDGSVYAAHEAQASTLSAAEPESFGFLGNESGSISLSGLETNNVELTFKPGTDVGLIGNNIQIKNATIGNADFSQAGLKMALIATGSESTDIILGTPTDKATQGDLSIRNADLVASGNGLGRIDVRSNHFAAVNSTLFLGNFNNNLVDGQEINVQAHSLILDNSKLFATTNSTGSSGDIVVKTNSLELENSSAITSFASENSSGNSGDVLVNTSILKMDHQSTISSASLGNMAGNVIVQADSLIMNNLSQIFSSAASQTGDVIVIGNDLTLNGSIISNAISGNGSIGDITVSGDSLHLNNNSVIGVIIKPSSSPSISSGSTIAINAKELLSNDSTIQNTIITEGAGIAGDIIINADYLSLNRSGDDKPGGIFSTVIGTNEGNSGNIIINSQEIEINNGLVSNKVFGASGQAGDITVSTDFLNMNGGLIRSDTEAAARAGSINIDANQMVINLQGRILVETKGEGDAGNISMVIDTLEINYGSISANTWSAGNAGSISIDAESIGIENAFIVNETYGSGNAGIINISADSVQLHENGFISASTFGSGRSGNIQITTNKLSSKGTGLTDIDLRSAELSGVFSGADSGSSGQTGSINIGAKEGGQLDIQLENSAYISIQNKAKVTDNNTATAIPIIDIDTTNLSLINSFITTQSSGNVDAGSIDIHFTGQLFLDPSTISTEANQGNGGDITIAGGEIVYLLDSAITTSVTGQTGDGGDISISADNMIMQSGFIQANTAAVGASGGDVDIKVPVLVPSGGFLQTGGNTPFDFQPFSGINVIQAAAPDGVSGTITAASPQLNLSGVLTNLVIESFDSSTLSQNMCAVEQGSSLYQSGKGGLRMRARDFLLLPVY